MKFYSASLLSISYCLYVYENTHTYAYGKGGGRWEGTARRHNVKNKNAQLATERSKTRSQKLFGTTPRVEEAPAIWYRWNATVGTKKQNKFLCPPPPPRSLFSRVPSSDLAAHFSRGIRHYLEPPYLFHPFPDIKSTARRKGISLLLPFLCSTGRAAALAERKRSISRCELSTTHF